VAPAEYPDGATLTLDRDSTVEDICDFVVEYINSNVLGLLSDRLLVIAGESGNRRPIKRGNVRRRLSILSRIMLSSG